MSETDKWVATSSIAQQHSLKPLSVTERCMRKLLSCHCVVQSFLPILFAFGEQPRASEQGSGSLTVHKGPRNTYRRT